MSNQKTAQHTKLDEIILQKQNPDFQTRDMTQKELPFEDHDLRSEVRNKSIYDDKEKLKPKDPLQINNPNIQQDQIQYRNLNNQEIERLKEDDDREYKHRQLYQYLNKDKPFTPPNEKYYELNKMLPEEAKKQIIEKYNELKTISTKFMFLYNEANSIAANKAELDYSKTYFDLFRNFGKFVIAALTNEIGRLFGSVPETGRRSGGRDAYSAAELANFIIKGINLFNITPLNFATKIYEMQSAIVSMNSILSEYEKKKKLLKKLPIEVNEGVKSFLLKKDTRKFLKYLDEYFPNDKEEFITNNINQLMSTYSSGQISAIHIGDLQKIKTYVDIYYKSRKAATLDLKYSLETQTANAFKERLQEEITSKIIPKINNLDEMLSDLKSENIDILVKYFYRNYRFDLRPIFQFVQNSMKMRIDEEDKERFGGEKYQEFINEFIADFKGKIKDFLNVNAGGSKRRLTYFTDEITKKYNDRGVLKFEELSKLTSKDLEEFANQYIKETVIKALLNFADRNHAYDRPLFNGVGNIIKETGKFSVDATVQFAHSKVPFVPKEFLTHLVKTLFKGETRKDENDLQTMTANRGFRELSYLSGTNNQFTVKVLLDILKRNNKFNPDSFTNIFLKSFEDLNKIIGRFGAELKNVKEKDKLKIFQITLRNQDTLFRDIENLTTFISFLHNSAGNIPSKDIPKLFENKNFIAYTKSNISKKLLKAYSMIRNLGGGKGIKKKYEQVIKQMKIDGFISKEFEKNINFVVATFNTNELIVPGSDIAKRLFTITSTVETDLQSLEMSDAFKDLLNNYENKDKRLFNLNLDISPTLRFRVLKDKDPRALRVGIETNCCQRIGGVGEVAARDSFVNPLAGVLLLEWNDGGDWELLTQSYFHYVPEKNSFILDNIEAASENVEKSEVDLGAAYAFLAKAIKEKFNVGYFIAGKGYSKLNTDLFKTYKLKGRDPRFFDNKSLTSDNKSHYTDFQPSNSMDLLMPKFDLNKRIDKLTGRIEKIKDAFDRAFNLIKIG